MMESLALLNSPAPDFDNFDCLERAPFAKRLEDFIQTERLFVEGSLVLSLNAAFGSGKTTFLRMWEKSLKDRRDKATDKTSVPIPITLNVWETEYAGDPLLALISELIRVLEESGEFPKEKFSQTIESLKDIVNYGIGVGNGIASKIGFDSINAGKFAQEMKDKRAEIAPDLLNTFKKKKNALRTLKETLEKCLEGGNQIFFFIDELDRCRPDYAIAFLETIKHIFPVNGFVFVVAANEEQLEESAKTLFGDNLNFREYFRRFVHRSIDLPGASSTGMFRLMEKFWPFVGNEKLGRFQRLLGDECHATLCKCLNIKITPRQLNEILRILGHLTSGHQPQGKLHDYVEASSLLMILLFVCEPKTFQAIENNALSVIEIKSLVDRIISTEEANSEWWIALIINGLSLTEDDRIPAIKAHLIPDVPLLKDYVKLHIRFGSNLSFSKIAQKIRELESFAR